MKKLLVAVFAVAMLLNAVGPALASSRSSNRRPSNSASTSTYNQATVINTVELVANTGSNSQISQAKVEKSISSEANAGGEDKTIETGNATATSYITVIANAEDCSCPEAKNNRSCGLSNNSSKTKNQAYVDNMVLGAANTGDNKQKEEAEVKGSLLSKANASVWGDREISTGDAEAKSTLRVMTNLRVNGFGGLFD